MKITINDIPPSLNLFAGRQNNWQYRHVKQKWTEMVAWSAKAEKKKQSWECPKLATVGIVYYFPDKRRRDPDNYCGKFVLDGLTRAGIIEDDCFSSIVLTLQGRVDKENPRTEIFVHPRTEEFIR